MVWNKFFIFLILALFQLSAFGQSYFINQCEYATGNFKNEILWIKHLFKVDTCKDVAQKLSTLKSYNEFMVKMDKQIPLMHYPWTNAFPEIYGLKTKYDFDDVRRILKTPMNPMEFFAKPETYEDFKNLTMIDLTDARLSGRVCSLFKNIRHIKTAIIDWGNLREIAECDQSIVPELIISRDFLGSGREKFASKVIGIEAFSGHIRYLKGYPNLRYVGLQSFPRHEGLRPLIANQNLTHLSMNSHHPFENDISEIKEIVNLSYLTLTCIKNDDPFTLEKKLDAPVPCDEPYLKDISFLAELEWLEEINLSYSGLDHVEGLEKMVNLKSINLSNNNISKLPDLKNLTQLKYLNIENNPVAAP